MWLSNPYGRYLCECFLLSDWNTQLPIVSNEKSETDYRAYEWAVVDENELARLVALLTLGHFRHVNRILRSLASNTVVARRAAINRAVEELSKTGDGHLENRDGWIFQFISWIALARRSNGTVLLDAPHPMPSQKGFDGIGIRLAATKQTVEFVLLSEDKATDNPRATFASLVVPEIKDIEAGNRDSQILSRVTTLVNAHSSDEGVREGLLSSSFYGKSVRFRVCIGTTLNKLPRKCKLFDGYADCVSGNKERRGGEVLALTDLRKWLQTVADKAIVYLKSLPVESEGKKNV